VTGEVPEEEQSHRRPGEMEVAQQEEQSHRQPYETEAVPQVGQPSRRQPGPVVAGEVPEEEQSHRQPYETEAVLQVGQPSRPSPGAVVTGAVRGVGRSHHRPNSPRAAATGVGPEEGQSHARPSSPEAVREVEQTHHVQPSSRGVSETEGDPMAEHTHCSSRRAAVDVAVAVAGTAAAGTEQARLPWTLGHMKLCPRPAAAPPPRWDCSCCCRNTFSCSAAECNGKRVPLSKYLRCCLFAWLFNARFTCVVKGKCWFLSRNENQLVPLFDRPERFRA
jgi:hypothetical protein